MSLYDEVLNIAKEYMGPAAENFMSRRIRSIRVNEPGDLKKEDLYNLATAVQATGKIYLSETQVIKFKQDILALQDK